MCNNEAWGKFKQGPNILDVCKHCYSVLELQDEIKKLNQYWVDRYNELKEALSVSIGVRNNKIKEQADTISKQKTEFEFRIGLLESGYEIQEKRRETLEKQLKKLTEQVDSNRAYISQAGYDEI